jgi:hypothetical protein
MWASMLVVCISSPTCWAFCHHWPWQTGFHYDGSSRRPLLLEYGLQMYARDQEYLKVNLVDWHPIHTLNYHLSLKARDLPWLDSMLNRNPHAYVQEAWGLA